MKATLRGSFKNSILKQQWARGRGGISKPHADLPGSHYGKHGGGWEMELKLRRVCADS